MKRIFTILFTAMLAGQAWADYDFKIDNVCYSTWFGDAYVECEDDSDDFANNYSGLSTVTIPDTVEYDGDKYPVVGISRDAFKNCSSLTSITLPNTIHNIREYAFEGCSGLESVVIPNSVTSIGENVFCNCTSLSSATLPDTIKYIPAAAFGNCSSLTSIEIPNTVTFIGNGAFAGSGLTSIEIPYSVTDISGYAFQNCTGLTSVVIPLPVNEVGFCAFKGCSNASLYCEAESEPTNWHNQWNPDNRPVVWGYKLLHYEITSDSTVMVVQSDDYKNLTKVVIPEIVEIEGNKYKVTSIDYRAFRDCEKIKSATIPNSIISIGREAFRGCKNLATVSIGNSVKIIDSSTFYDCRNLTSINIPQSVTNIEPSAFWLCVKLTDINVENGNTNFSSENGIVFSKDKKTIICYPEGKTDESYSIPNTVTSIGRGAFAYSKLKTISIPESVLSIGENAFMYSQGFESVTIPNSVTKIDSYAFMVCTGLKSVIIPNSVTYIGSQVFYDCYSLASAILSNSITSISSNVFGECDNLVYNEFDNACYLGTNDNQYFALIKAKSTDITSCEINSNCKIIASSAFKYCNNLTTVSIPESVTYIDDYSFYGCENLQFNEYDNALYWGTNEKPYVVLVKAKSTDITSCEIGSGCKIIFDCAFLGCDNLTSISIPNSVVNIGERAFQSCSKLESVAIPNSVINIGAYAFYISYGSTIYCGAELKPKGWNDNWIQKNATTVVWGLGPDFKIFNVTVETNNSSYGSVAGSGTVIGDSTVTIVAKPANGYHFIGWSNGATDTSYSFTVTQDSSLTATFEAHIIATDSTVAATCTESGLTEGTHCSVCNAVLVKQDTIAALGHTVVTDSAVAATCTKPGLTEGKHCSVCNAVLEKQDTIPAKGHTIVIDAAVEPTCTETGLGEGKHCSACNEVLIAQTEIPSLGHEFVNYIYNNDATTEADGTETAVCEHGCGETDTRVAEGTKLATTAVSESAANAVNIYAYGNTIVVENATDEIRVYDAMGTLVGRDVARNVCTIKINNSGVYIVKTGNAVKRVVVN